jgi:hypothetical protein
MSSVENTRTHAHVFCLSSALEGANKSTRCEILTPSIFIFFTKLVYSEHQEEGFKRCKTKKSSVQRDQLVDGLVLTVCRATLLSTRRCPRSGKNQSISYMLINYQEYLPFASCIL